MAMAAPRLFLVDVFAQSPLAGNPLAVVVSDTALADATMQAIAAEMNFSETTFVPRTARADGAFPVRMFTPAQEVDFAGHPILGTAWVVRRNVLRASAPEIRLALNVGVVPVTFEGKGHSEVAWFEAPPVTLGARLPPSFVARALGLGARDVEMRPPVQVARSGTPATLVPVRSLDALRRARLDLARLGPLVSQGAPKLAYLFCREAEGTGNHVTARFFFVANGVREDPATGNGAAFLGAYLLEHGVMGPGPLDLRIEQGTDVGRPSLVRLRAHRAQGRVVTSVGGGVLPVARGVLEPGVHRPVTVASPRSGRVR
ncbi:MAG: PhzF family phenazine biosynthesis protein [Betaproteobacteria bacterium]|nr:PhzF family phenazine biosynthesis protein [Betaproteobacteria bacterium]